MTALGVSLLLIGGLMILIEAHVPQLGLIGGAGVVALGVGAVLAVGGLGGGVLLGILVALVLVAVGGVALALVVGKGLAVRRSARTEQLIGHMGQVRQWDGEKGSVLVDGALWHARPSWPEEISDLQEGDAVIVERRHGLTLCVRPAEKWELVR
jgi:membrane-bound serine protease (ClpP class)